MNDRLQETNRAWGKYFSNAADVRRLTWTPFLCYILLYGHFALCLLAWLPFWTFCLSAPILVVRWLLSLHELLHLRSESEVDPITRLLPLMLTPQSLGYREFLKVHQGHHRYMATPDDPEYFQLRGSKLHGLFNAMTAPEQSFFRWLRRCGVDTELAIGALLRCALFVLLLTLSSGAFLWYWIPVRLSFGASYFAFFYALHRRGTEYGVYRITLPVWARRLFSLLFGREALLATLYHDIHHAQPRIGALHLHEVAQVWDLPQTGLPVK